MVCAFGLPKFPAGRKRVAEQRVPLMHSSGGTVEIKDEVMLKEVFKNAARYRHAGVSAAA